MSKQLAIDPTVTASIINVAITSVGANPYRDMVMFPIQESKVLSLVESIEKTGFWPSIIARPKNNEINGKPVTREELDNMIANGFDFSGVVWEKAFAHHRQAACERLGFATIPIIPQIINDENMLLMMANENKEGFGSNINSQLETVRQVKTRLEESIADYDEFEMYVNDGGTFFTTAKSFKNAQSQGIGFKTIRRFLGETWSDRDVRGPVAVLKAIDDGLFYQEDIVNVPSIGLLEGIASIARVLYEGHTPQEKDAEPVPAPNWPMYFKDAAMAAVIERCQLDADKGKHESTVTVAQLDKARQLLQKVGVNPANFLRSGKGKTAFDVYEATKAEVIIPDVELEKNLAAIEELRERDGFDGWEGLEELITKLKAAANRIAEAGGVDSPDVDAELDPTTEGDVNAAINAAEGEVAAAGEAGPDAFGEAIPHTGALPINQLVVKVTESCEVMGSMVGSLIPRAGEIEVDDTYTMAITDLLKLVAKLANDTLGKSAVVDAFNAATKAPETVDEM